MQVMKSVEALMMAMVMACLVEVPICACVQAIPPPHTHTLIRFGLDFF